MKGQKERTAVAAAVLMPHSEASSAVVILPQHLGNVKHFPSVSQHLQIFSSAFFVASHQTSD